jgi:CsoR family transcriptional regulator, copper-sensing transcriptional repressor
MLATAGLDAKTRSDLIARLKSIEGQARGIQRMLSEEQDCQAIMDQMTALRAASHSASMQALQAFAMHCLRNSTESSEQVMAQLLAIVSKLTR